MQKSDSIANLGAAMALAQPAVKTAIMGSTNPFFKSKYADLGAIWDAVREALKVHGLSVIQMPDALGSDPALTTVLLHQTGEWISGTYPLIVSQKDETAQGYGSAMTYARRYGLAAVMGVIADEDDDGNAASKPALKPLPAVAQSETKTASTTPTNYTGGVSQKDWKVWGNKVLDTARKAPLDKLDSLLEKNSGDLVKLRVQEPLLHGDIIRLIQSRQELGK